jgi:hypothetical protein
MATFGIALPLASRQFGVMSPETRPKVPCMMSDAQTGAGGVMVLTHTAAVSVSVRLPMVRLDTTPASPGCMPVITPAAVTDNTVLSVTTNDGAPLHWSTDPVAVSGVATRVIVSYGAVAAASVIA